MRIVATMIGTAVLVAGCGHSTAKLSQAHVEAVIRHWAIHKEQAKPSVKVSCPADVPIVAGSTFHCLVTGGGQAVRLVVTIENDQGYLTWTVG